MRSVCVLVLVLLLVASQALAQSEGAVIGKSFTATAIATGATSTSEYIDVGYASRIGIDWSITPDSGSPSVNVIILQCNSATGTFSEWASTSLASTTVTNNVTITTANGGSDLKLPPSGYIKVKVINSSAYSATIDRLWLYYGR